MEDCRGKFQNYEAMEAADSAWRESGRGMDKLQSELTTLRTELSASRAEVEALRGLVRKMAEDFRLEADSISAAGPRYVGGGVLRLTFEQGRTYKRATEPASREGE